MNQNNLEYEVKFLNINPEEITEKLISRNARKVFEKLYKRKVYDYPDLRLHKVASWVRLRDEGEHITLTYKQRLGVGEHGTNDSGMKEIELVVSDFRKADLFLQSIGLVEKFYIENKRIRFELEDIEFDIDFYPLINPYLEIEAPSWERVEEAIALLELDGGEKKIMSATQVYALAGITDSDYSILTFEKQVKR